MNEEEIRQIAQKELSKQIMENLDSGIIFKYINTLEERNKNLEQIELDDYISKDKIKELQNKYIGQYLKFYEKVQELLEESEK